MDVSFLIPVFNCLPLTRACLDSLEKTLPPRLRWEALIIDDGSTDGSRAWFAELARKQPARYRVFLNDPPRQGYARNNNRAAEAARGEILCLLNNDTVLLPGWLEPMLHTLRRAPAAALVGNIQREPGSGLINHAGIVFNLRGIPIHFGLDTAVPPDREPWTRWPAVTAACCVVRRELFLGLGGFDEGFQNGFEDVDLCLRAGERGWRHYVANRSTIYHHISASPDRHARERENLRRFRARWSRRILSWHRRRRWARRQLLRHPEIAGSWPRQDDGQPLPLDAATLLGWLKERRSQRPEKEARRDGWRYLRKHALRPWRYNFGRLSRALENALQPLPPRARDGAEPPAAIDEFFAPFESRRPTPGGLVLFDQPTL